MRRHEVPVHRRRHDQTQTLREAAPSYAVIAEPAGSCTPSRARITLASFSRRAAKKASKSSSESPNSPRWWSARTAARSPSFGKAAASQLAGGWPPLDSFSAGVSSWRFGTCCAAVAYHANLIVGKPRGE